MFCSAEMVNKASTTGDSGLKPLIFGQLCQQNSHLHPPRMETNDCLCYRSAASSSGFPELAIATSLVSSLRPGVQSSRELESSCVPA